MDKAEQVWEEIKRRAREVVPDGEMVLKVITHTGKIVGAEIIRERIKIG